MAVVAGRRPARKMNGRIIVAVEAISSQEQCVLCVELSSSKQAQQSSCLFRDVPRGSGSLGRRSQLPLSAILTPPSSWSGSAGIPPHSCTHLAYAKSSAVSPASSRHCSATMANSAELRQLLRVLDERSVPMDPDDITNAFQVEATRLELTAWIQEHLTLANLLTKEELALYVSYNLIAGLATDWPCSNSAHSSVSKQKATNNTSRPLVDDDFEAAIKSLEASTAAIEKQCAVLEVQKQALADLKARQGSNTAASSSQDERQKKLAREKAQLEFEVSELASSLSLGLQASSKQADTAVAALPQSVDRVFEKDDRLLDGLQKLLPKLAESDTDQVVAADVDRLCTALAALSAREIRMRMNAVYQAHAASATSVANGDTPKQAKKQIASLRAELDELSNEIDGLATMAVDGQYRLPITRELRSAGGDADSDRARWSEYLVATLGYLTTRLTALEEHFQHLCAHQGALRHVGAALDSAMAKPDRKREEVQAALRSPATPTARGLKPLRLVQANLAEPQDPVTQVLRSFDIKVTDTSDTIKLATTLQQALAEKQSRTAELGRRTERNISDQLVETIGKADKHVLDLLGAVYAHTQYGSVQLMDPELKAVLDELEEKTSGLGDEMRMLDVDGIGRIVKGKQRDVLARA